MRSSNPVLSRLTPETHRGGLGQRGYAPDAAGYAAGGYTLEGARPGILEPATDITDRMTIDDVVVRTVGLLGITGISGAVAWTMLPMSTGILFGAAIVGLILGLVIAFGRIANPALIGAYGVVQGVVLGMVSRLYEAFYSGIVIQAVVATFGIFFVMALLYKTRILRATPTFVKWVTGALIGVLVLMLANFIVGFFHPGGLGLRTGGGLSILFSLVVIGIAALTFILDFAQVEEGVNAGLSKRYAWLCAFGILVGLIWLYLEILRLLSYLRGDD